MSNAGLKESFANAKNRTWHRIFFRCTPVVAVIVVVLAVVVIPAAIVDLRHETK